MGGLTQRAWTPTKRRGPIAAEYSSPGPACVYLPSYIGQKTVNSASEQSPAYTFGARHLDKVDSVGPGPGQYNIVGLSVKGKDTPLAQSLHSRPKESKHDIFPAPGDYDPDVVSTSAPKYSFGLRTNVAKPMDTPAPNVYDLHANFTEEGPKYSFGAKTNTGNSLDTPAPNVYNISSSVGDLRSSPSYTISGRHKELFDERIKHPGPGQYNDVPPENYKTQHSPTYSISGRHTIHGDTKTPGPGMYSPEKVTYHLPSIQSHSFGIRHSPFLMPHHLTISRDDRPPVDIDCTPSHSFGIKHSPYSDHY